MKDTKLMIHLCPDIEEGVGNAHPNHSLANSTQTGKPEPERENTNDQEEDKSVLQVFFTTSYYFL